MIDNILFLNRIYTPVTPKEPKDLDTYLQPIIQRLNDELLEAQKPPEKIDPAAAPYPDTGGRFGGAGYSVAVKEAKVVRHGTETWDYSVSSIIERAGRADGNLALGEYPEQVRNSLFAEVRAGQWNKVYYRLPDLPSAVDAASLRLRLRSHDKIVDESYFNWTEQNGWWNNHNESVIANIGVSLLGVNNFEPKTSSWQTRFDVTVGDETVAAEVSDPLEGVNAGLYVPSQLIRFLTVSARGIRFESPVPDSPQLFKVDIKLSDGLRTKRHSFFADENGQTGSIVWPAPSIRDGHPTKFTAFIKFSFLDRDACELNIGAEKFEKLFSGDTISLKLLAYRECHIRI